LTAGKQFADRPSVSSPRPHPLDDVEHGGTGEQIAGQGAGAAGETQLTAAHLASESTMIFRTGKNNYALLRFV
jgi:hypothetical protein